MRSKKLVFTLYTLSALMWVLAVTSCNPFTTAPADGPFKVGVHISYITVENRPVKLTTWYPANLSDDTPPYTFENQITGQAVLDAGLNSDEGPYPLIIFSPGMTAPGDTYVFYTQNLASHGYVVIGIDHLDAADDPNEVLSYFGFGTGLMGFSNLLRSLEDMGADNSSDAVCVLFGDWFFDTDFALTYRPQEISAAIDQAVEWNQDRSSPFYGMIDTNNIGMTGHSLGGWMTLLKGGMPIYCDYQPTRCNASVITNLDPCCTESVQAMEGNAFAFKDSRIKAMVSLAPPIFQKDTEIGRNAAAIDTPMMIITGDDPRWESSFAPIWEVYSHASHQPKYLIMIRNTDHLVVNDVFETLGEALQDLVPGNNHHFFMQKAKAYKDYSAAFFNLYLKGDTGKKRTLHYPNQYFVSRIWYED